MSTRKSDKHIIKHGIYRDVAWIMTKTDPGFICAYVDVKSSVTFSQCKDFWDVNELLDYVIHGGCTYFETHCMNSVASERELEEIGFKDGDIIIGWDYAHHDDIDLNKLFQHVGLVTLVPEDKIEQDIRDAIDAILKIDTSFVSKHMSLSEVNS